MRRARCSRRAWRFGEEGERSKGNLLGARAALPGNGGAPAQVLCQAPGAKEQSSRCYPERHSSHAGLAQGVRQKQPARQRCSGAEGGCALRGRSSQSNAPPRARTPRARKCRESWSMRVTGAAASGATNLSQAMSAVSYARTSRNRRCWKRRAESRRAQSATRAKRANVIHLAVS